MTKKYLTTGASGKLGKHLFKLLPCTTPAKRQLNILKPDQINKYLSTQCFKAIIHLAAISSCNLAQKNKLLSYKTNVIGTRNIVTSAKKYHTKIFYISSDYVFDCLSGNYKESDSPNPANWYGFTKLAAELEIQSQTSNYCIIRTSFRPSKWPFATAYTNVFTSADYTDIIAQEIALAIRQNLNGIIHIGTSKKSLYDLAKRRNLKIKPKKCIDANFPKNRHLNLTKWQHIKSQINHEKSHNS